MSNAQARTNDPNWVINDMEVSIASTSNNLYTNGLQQVLVRFWVKAMLNNQEVKLTPAEVRNLRVVHHGNMQALPINNSGAGWSVSDIDNGYDFHPDPGAVNPPGNKPGGEEFYFYLSARDVRAGIKVPLAIMLTGDNNRKYCTNGRSWSSNGDEDYFDVFPSTLEIMPRAPETYPINNFVFEKTSSTRTADEIAQSPVFTDVYSLALHSGAGTQIDLKEVVCTPKGMIQWAAPNNDETFASYTGYAEPGSTTLVWNTSDSVPTGPSAKPTLSSSERGKGQFVLVGRVNIPYQHAHENGPCRAQLIDAFGNPHEVIVSFRDKTPEGRFTLVIKK